MGNPTDELAQLLSKADRRITQDPSRKPAWKFSTNSEAHMLEDAISSKMPVYPSRANGKNRFDGSVIAVQFDSSMKGYWSFDDPISGTICYDAIQANRNNGFMYGGAAIVSGKYNQCVSFSGSPSYVSIPHHADYNFGTADFTIELWTNPSGTAGSETLLSKDDGLGVAQIRLGVNTANGLLIGHIGGGTIDGRTSIDLRNAWHYIAVVRESGTVRINVDEIQDASFTGSGNLTVMNRDLLIGAYMNSLGGIEQNLNGKTDEVRLYNTALSVVRLGQHARNYRFQ